MLKLHSAALATVVVAVLAVATSDAKAGGGQRAFIGGHPYHNGAYYIPPSSAYEFTRVFPPTRYGIPAYYVPASYLPVGNSPAFPYAQANAYPVMHPYTWYPGVPQGKAGGYYLSAYGYYHTAKW